MMTMTKQGRAPLVRVRHACLYFIFMTADARTDVEDNKIRAVMHAYTLRKYRDGQMDRQAWT